MSIFSGPICGLHFSTKDTINQNGLIIYHALGKEYVQELKKIYLDKNPIWLVNKGDTVLLEKWKILNGKNNVSVLIFKPNRTLKKHTEYKIISSVKDYKYFQRDYVHKIYTNTIIDTIKPSWEVEPKLVELGLSKQAEENFPPSFWAWSPHVLFCYCTNEKT